MINDEFTNDSFCNRLMERADWMIGGKGSGGGGALYSSSELHLNRVTSRNNVQPQWVLGGSEVNLTCLSR